MLIAIYVFSDGQFLSVSIFFSVSKFLKPIFLFHCFVSSLAKHWLKRRLVGLWQYAFKLDLILLIVTCPSALPKTPLLAVTQTLCPSLCPGSLLKTSSKA